MSAAQICPECGAELPVDAPGGLCPTCLIGAAIADTQQSRAQGTQAAPSDRQTVFGPEFAEMAEVGRSAPVDLDRFRRAILDLGLIRADEFERFVVATPGGVPALAMALVRARKLTLYQSGALLQGKARGLVIGNYFVLDKLGEGGMGVVFKAKHRRLKRVVALKILPPSLARDKKMFLRFRREVDVAARLSHPNIVSVLDADEDRGVPFMTMEYVEGTDLDRLVRDRGVLAIDQALDCLIQAARGMEAAHAQGIVHRDIKPANLMRDGSGQVRVLDLGLARLVEAANAFGATAAGSLTQSGTCMGTVDFMAPEQGIDSRRVDHRADIYSLGCTLCYLLTGRPPFGGTTVLARLMAHQDLPPSSLREARRDVPEAVDVVYHEMMAKKPADRPASMREVIERFEACRALAGNIRSDVNAVADNVTITGDSSRETVRDLVFHLDESVAAQPIWNRVLDNRDLRGSEVAEARTIVERPAPVPQRTNSARFREMASPQSLAFALAAITLLAITGLAYSLFPRGADNSAADRGNVAGSEFSPNVKRLSDRSTAESKQAMPLATRLSPTFDVTTLYTIYGYDGRAASVETIAVTADGRRALIGSWTEFCELIDVVTGKRVHPAEWQGARPTVAMTPDGRRGLIGTLAVRKDNVKRVHAREAGIVWFPDLTTGKHIFPKQQPYNGGVTSVAIAHDGLRGLTASGKGELTLWDLTTGEPSRSLGPQRGKVMPHAMAFFPDGRRAATAGHDKLVHIWDLDTGAELAAWNGHDDSISGLAISPDGRRVVTAGFDARVVLWDADGGAILHRFALPPDDTGAHVAFDPESNIVVAGNGTDGPPARPGNLIVWDGNSPYTELRRDERPFARHMAVAALPGGRVLTGDRYALRLWTPREPRAIASAPSTPPNRDPSPVNLLALIEPDTYEIGNWQKLGETLLSPTTGGARLQIPYAPPPEYRIDMEVERVGKPTSYGFALGCVVDGRQMELGFDQVIDQLGKCTGLHGFDGAPLEAGPRFHRGEVLSPNRRARLTVIVRRKSITLNSDGTNLLNWKGDPTRFVPYFRWHVPDPHKLFLASNSSVLFHEMTLTPLMADSP